MYGFSAKIGYTEHPLLRFHFHSTQRFEPPKNINSFDLSFFQSGTKKEVNTLLCGYPPNKSNTLNQIMIKFAMIFLKNLVTLINHYSVSTNDFMFC